MQNGRKVVAEAVSWGVIEHEEWPRNLLEALVWAKESEVEAKRVRMPLSLMKSRLKAVEDVKPRRMRLPRLEAVGGDGDTCALIFKLGDREQSPDAMDELAIQNIAAQSDKGAVLVQTSVRHSRHSYEWMRAARSRVECPVICQDIFVYPWQFYEARYYHADACVLIFKVLGARDTLYFAKAMSALGMAPIVEVHDASEMDEVMWLFRGDAGADRPGAHMLLARRAMHDLSVRLDGVETLLAPRTGRLESTRTQLLLELPAGMRADARMRRAFRQLGVTALIADA